MPHRHAAPARRLSGRWAKGLIAAGGLALAGVSAPAQAGPTDLYYERTLMTAANQKCGLFTPELASALESAQAQARGAALRSGVAGDALTDTARSAWRRAAETPCDSRDLAMVAARVRSAFASYAHLLRMTFPGDSADWRADRTTAMRRMTWRLAQTSRFGPDSLTFGLAGQLDTSALIAVASFADDAQPYAARLVLRDVSRAPNPNIGGFSQGGRTGLAARMPLRPATTAFVAEARAAADPWLITPGAHSGVAFRFPRAAIDALVGLDPREAVAVEFLFGGRGGDTVRTAYVEVGDFAAGRAFLVASQR